MDDKGNGIGSQTKSVTLVAWQSKREFYYKYYYYYYYYYYCRY